MIWKEISQMANCQNNMRYGRQMHQGNFRSMPSGGSGRPEPSAMPGAGRKCRTPDQCPPEGSGCRAPQQCMPEPCGCQAKPRYLGEQHMPECGAPKHREHEGCGRRNDALSDFPLAMAYVPWQKWQNVFDPCKGFTRGTIFEDLSKPVHGRGGCNQ